MKLFSLLAVAVWGVTVGLKSPKEIFASFLNGHHELLDTNANLPKIYMYDFPDSFRQPDCPKGAERFREKDGLGCLFGNKFYLRTFDAEQNKTHSVLMRVPSEFSLAKIFFWRMQRYPVLVKDPAEADLFYVPTFGNNFDPKHPEYKCPSLEELKKRLDHYSESTAYKHFVVYSRTASNSRRDCPIVNISGESDELDEYFRPITRLALEDHPERNILSVPYPSPLSGLPKAAFDTTVDGIFNNLKTNVVGGTFGVHGKFSALRNLLKSECEMSEVCEFVEIKNHHKPEFMELYAKSLFCLQPPGDTLSRKGILDSMAGGCIPVIFADRQQSLWKLHIPNWKDVSILVPNEPIGEKAVIPYLQNISPEKIANLRGNIKALLPRLVFEHTPCGDECFFDYFEHTVTSLSDAIKKAENERKMELNLNMKVENGKFVEIERKPSRVIEIMLENAASAPIPSLPSVSSLPFAHLTGAVERKDPSVVESDVKIDTPLVEANEDDRRKVSETRDSDPETTSPLLARGEEYLDDRRKVSETRVSDPQTTSPLLARGEGYLDDRRKVSETRVSDPQTTSPLLARGERYLDDRRKVSETRVSDLQTTSPLLARGEGYLDDRRKVSETRVSDPQTTSPLLARGEGYLDDRRKVSETRVSDPQTTSPLLARGEGYLVKYRLKSLGSLT